jgi:hypothetical protein
MRHPDEGQIHAWLDGAVDPATAAGLEAHVAACPDCAAAVAEARGLIAGASRILLALDNVPAGVIPAPADVADPQASDDLAAYRVRQHGDTKIPQRRHIPWYARRSVQVAASLMLVAGIGGVVVRNSDRADEKVFIDIETDAAPATRGPAAAEQRQASVVAAEPAAPPAPPMATAPLSGVATAAPFASAATANLPAPVVLDSTPAPLARGLNDMAAVRRSLTTASGTISGKVIGPDEAPIPMAVVAIASMNVTVQTAADGSFTLPPLAPGRYTLEARRIGYGPARVEGVEIVAGDTAYARVAMQPSLNQLSGVVVTGVGAAGTDLNGACFILTVSPAGRGIPILPRRVRFQLADLAAPADESKSADSRAQSRAESRGAGEPSTPLSWQPKSGNAFDVTWPINGDVVTLSLTLRGSTVSGYALTQSFPIRSAGIDGRKVDCSSR